MCTVTRLSLCIGTSSALSHRVRRSRSMSLQVAATFSYSLSVVKPHSCFRLVPIHCSLLLAVPLWHAERQHRRKRANLCDLCHNPIIGSAKRTLLTREHQLLPRCESKLVEDLPLGSFPCCIYGCYAGETLYHTCLIWTPHQDLLLGRVDELLEEKLADRGSFLPAFNVASGKPSPNTIRLILWTIEAHEPIRMEMRFSVEHHKSLHLNSWDK